MAKLENSLQKGQKKYQEAQEKQQNKRTKRPVTTTGLIQYFQDLYTKYKMGRIPPLTKDTRNKVSGLIRNLKSNGFSDDEIWDFIGQIFANWNSLKAKDFYTDNRKSYILASTPDLKDIINCKGQFIQELTQEKDEDLHSSTDEEEDLFEIWKNLE